MTSELVAQVDALIGADARGRLSGARETFYVFRTAEGAICRCHIDLPDDIAAELGALAERPRGRPSEWQREYGDYLQVLGRVGRVGAVRAGPLYRALDVMSPAGDAVSITRENANLLEGGLEEWLPDVARGLPMAVSITQGHAVSVCASVAAAGGAHAAGVETRPGFRRQGFGATAVAGRARMVRDLGATPFYGTTFDNLASQNLAHRLGMELVGSEFSVECDLGR